MNTTRQLGEHPTDPAPGTVDGTVDETALTPAGRPPAVDLTPVVVTAEVVIGAVAVARILARRPSVPRTKVTMGPGGWVSVKGGTVGVRRGSRPWGRPRLVTGTSASSRAPLWARVLSAVPLQVLSR
jgi:hypothetical protein